MIVILKDYGKTCLCAEKLGDKSEYFMGTKQWAKSIADAMGQQFVDVSTEVEQQKLLEHNKVLIVKS